MTDSSSLPFFANIGILMIGTIAIALFAYSAYRAFRIRERLLVPVYRRQAMWIGASAVYWIIEYISLTVVAILGAFSIGIPQGANAPLVIFLIASLYFGLVFSFAWIDAVVGVARNSDPRNRNTLRWRYSRLVLWIVMLIGIISGSYLYAPSIIASGTGGPIGQVITFYAANVSLFWLIGFTGILVLFVSSFQSRDIVLRKQLKWFGLYILFLIFSGASAILASGALHTGSFSLLPTLAGTAIIDFALALCLYKSALSLVPLSHFPQKEVGKKV
jgi:hypothetical protein